MNLGGGTCHAYADGLKKQAVHKQRGGLGLWPLTTDALWLYVALISLKYPVAKCKFEVILDTY